MFYREYIMFNPFNKKSVCREQGGRVSMQKYTLLLDAYHEVLKDRALILKQLNAQQSKITELEPDQSEESIENKALEATIHAMNETITAELCAINRTLSEHAEAIVTLCASNRAQELRIEKHGVILGKQEVRNA